MGSHACNRAVPRGVLRCAEVLLVALVLLIGPGRTLRAAGPPANVPLRWLTTQMASVVREGWGKTANNAAVAGRPITIAGQRFGKGLGTHAPGIMTFPLGGTHRLFTAWVGVDDEAPRAGSVVFLVRLDGKLAFNSGVVRWGGAAKPIRLDLTGVRELTLEVTDADDGVQGDHADWAGAAIDDVVTARPVPPFSTAGFFTIPASPRRVYSFSPGWRFLKGDAAGAEKPGFNDSEWEAVCVPHGLELLGENASGGRNYQGPAWYRKRFRAPGGSPGKALTLYLEAVMGKCAVWVNGKRASEHFGGYLPFAVDLGPYLKPGAENLVAVRADNSDDPSYPPGKPQGDLDFTYMGGIYRNVYLIENQPIHVTLPEQSPTVAGGGVVVGTLSAADGAAEIEVRTEVVNSTAAHGDLRLRTTIEQTDGKLVERSEVALPLHPGQMRTLVQRFHVTGAHLWHPDDPYLHFVRTEILSGDRVVDSLLTRFGIRVIEMRGKEGMFINGKPPGHKLSGVNRHQDYAYVGNALPNSGQRRDALLLRAGGAFSVRAAHYPLSPAFLDACDELGLLVTTANPGWQFYNDKDPRFRARLFDDTRSLVRRDRNRPALFLWETAINETDNTPIEALKQLHQIVHAEDPFPGVYTVTDAYLAEPAGFDFLYSGNHEGPKNSYTREYGDGGRVDNFFSHNASVRVHPSWGEHAAIEQLKRRFGELDGVYGSDPIEIGAALWAGIDHNRGYHPDPFWGGLLDTFRVPRYSYSFYQSQISPDDRAPGTQARARVFITNELTQVSEPDVIVLSNCEQVRLTWLGKIVGISSPAAEYAHLPHPPFIFKDVFHFDEIATNWRDRTGSITMVAEGLIGGKVVCTEVKRYPERTTGIVLSVADEGVGIQADGSDFVPVRATIVDNKGVRKVLAQDDVTFEVEGEGSLIGGPANHANPVKAQFGIATALVRSTTRPGLIRVRARSAGLSGDEIMLRSTASSLPLVFEPFKGGAAMGGSAPIPRAAPTRGESSSAELDRLKAENRRLQLELTARKQDLMDVRGKSGR